MDGKIMKVYLLVKYFSMGGKMKAVIFQNKNLGWRAIHFFGMSDLCDLRTLWVHGISNYLFQ